MKTYLINLAFKMVSEHLLSDENIELMRKKFKKTIEEYVLDTENEWDDEAAKALFAFMGI